MSVIEEGEAVEVRKLLDSLELSMIELRKKAPFWRMLSTSNRQSFDFFLDDVKGYKQELR